MPATASRTSSTPPCSSAWCGGWCGSRRRTCWRAWTWRCRRCGRWRASRQREIDSIPARTPGGWFEGRLMGLELVVLEWQQLAKLPLDGAIAVDIDADYFVKVPHDRIWARPRVIVTALQERLGERRTSPSRVRWAPASCRAPPIPGRPAGGTVGRPRRGRAHWQRLLELEADPLPEDARIARLSALLGDRPDSPPPATRWRWRRPTRTNARCCWRAPPRSIPTTPATCCGIWARCACASRELDLATVVRLHRQLATWDAAPDRGATAWVALGPALCRLRPHRRGDRARRESRRRGGGHPDLALQIGRLEMAAGRADAAVPWLERAAMDDETRAAAWLHLSVCASRRGALAEAWNWARAATEAAPPGRSPPSGWQRRPQAGVRLGLFCP